MSNIPPGSVCERCGMGLHNDEQGRVACDGCDMPTSECHCPPDH